MPLLLLSTGLFYSFLRYHAFGSQLSEWDLYLAAIGLWDGYYSGQGVLGLVHYGKWHSFGYILLVYALGSQETFSPGGHLLLLMNALGFWATILCLPLLWFALATKYGREVAWPATALFIGSPVFLELAGGAHPVLLALSALLLGAALLWYPTQGLTQVALRLCAVIVLGAALSFRLEVVLAFPFLAMAGSAEQRWQPLVKDAFVRLCVLFAACAAFLIARSYFLTNDNDQSAQFIETWYRLSNVPIGFAALSLAVGIASMIALLWLGLQLAREIARDPTWSGRAAQAAPFLAPLSLAVVTLVFWIANPLPARHFLLFVLAAAVLIGICMAVQGWPLRRAMALSAVLIAGNQVLSAVVNPYVVQASGFAVHRDWPYLLTAPTGFAWDRREMLKQKWSQAMHAGQVLASGKCGRSVLVSAPLSSAVAAQIASNRPDAPISYRKLNYGGRTHVLTEMRVPVHALIYTRRSLQDPAIPRELLEDASLSEFQVAVISDRESPPDPVAIPRNRLASPLCSKIGT